MNKIARLTLIAAASLASIAGAATAAPISSTTATNAVPSLVERVRSNCQWVDNKWTYQKGDKRLVCRPNRPTGNGWKWHTEGQKSGWFHPKRKAWGHAGW